MSLMVMSTCSLTVVIAKFEKEHPNVEVTYESGISKGTIHRGYLMHNKRSNRIFL